MNKRTEQQTGYNSPVNTESRYTTGNQRQNMQDNGNNSDIEDFNYQYSKAANVYKTGDSPGGGVFVCSNCGNDVRVSEGEKLPNCPRCNNLKFVCKQ